MLLLLFISLASVSSFFFEQNYPIRIGPTSIVLYPPDVGGLSEILLIYDDSFTVETSFHAEWNDVFIKVYSSALNFTYFKSHPSASFGYSV